MGGFPSPKYRHPTAVDGDGVMEVMEVTHAKGDRHALTSIIPAVEEWLGTEM